MELEEIGIWHMGSKFRDVLQHSILEVLTACETFSCCCCECGFCCCVSAITLQAIAVGSLCSRRFGTLRLLRTVQLAVCCICCTKILLTAVLLLPDGYLQCVVVISSAQCKKNSKFVKAFHIMLISRCVLNEKRAPCCKLPYNCSNSALFFFHKSHIVCINIMIVHFLSDQPLLLSNLPPNQYKIFYYAYVPQVYFLCHTHAYTHTHMYGDTANPA